MAKEPYWKDWTEVWMAPVYGGEQGAPFVVLARSTKHAFELARCAHPTAAGWDMLGFVDPKDRECVLEGSLKGTQRLVVEMDRVERG